MFNKSCRWLDSNPGPLVSKATALPTAPQPLPKFVNDSCWLHPRRFFTISSSINFLMTGLEPRSSIVSEATALPTVPQSLLQHFFTGAFPASFSLFSSFHYSWEHIWICGWLDSNRGPLVSKATAQPTAPEPHCFNIVHLQCRDNVDNATHNCENDLGPKPFWRLLNFSAIDRQKFWNLTTYQVKCKLGAFMWA